MKSVKSISKGKKINQFKVIGLVLTVFILGLLITNHSDPFNTTKTDTSAKMVATFIQSEYNRQLSSDQVDIDKIIKMARKLDKRLSIKFFEDSSLVWVGIDYDSVSSTLSEVYLEGDN
jgi:hypothetical protein